MAGNGPAPSPNTKTQGATPADRSRFDRIAVDGEVRGPELSPKQPSGHDWRPTTIEWYERWRVSAQAQRFTPTDWDELFLAAILYDQVIGTDKGRTLAMAELRQRVAKLGATEEDRARLRYTIVSDASQLPQSNSRTPIAAVADISRRRRPTSK